MEASNLFQRLADNAVKDSGRGEAVVHGNLRLSYGELTCRASAFCDQLTAVGIQPRDEVAVILGNGADFLIAAFGIWKRGAVLVPLNLQLQESELLKYLAGSSVRAIVIDSRNISTGEAIQKNVRRIEYMWLCHANSEGWTYKGQTETTPSIQSNDSSDMKITGAWPAITQHSTGSTGHPKRVRRTHGQLLGESVSVSTVLGVGPADRILGVAPFSHSHGLMNSALLALLSGATLYTVESFFARDVAQLMERQGITLLPGVPFMFQLLSELRERHDLSSLRCAISAGGSLPETTAQAFADKYGIRVQQLYGSTETGVICIATRNGSSELGVVGDSIPGVSVRVVDDAGSDVPNGIIGRIQVTSEFSATAYVNCAGNSESYFDAGRFFPGDLGLLTSTGEIAIRGRHRGFINVGGNKVDPTEVESALLEMPQIVEAVVFGVPDGSASERIKAVLVTSLVVSHAEIRAHIKGCLAEFKHPRILEFRKELPKSLLGKVLRKYLMEEARADDLRSEFQLLPGLQATSGITVDPAFRFSMMPPFLRVLLVTDGTVTKSLEAYFGEPIDVDVLLHVEMKSERPYPAINVMPDDQILRRCVTLRGRLTRAVYAFAESIVVITAVSQKIRAKLIEGRKGIGELLREGGLETYSELLSLRRAEAHEWAHHLALEKSAGVAVRKYVISCAGRASIEIEEVFPESRFQFVA